MTKKNIDKKPLVSVIIPVYNVSQYLNECLDSVINQTYSNLEIIVVDDGSTDNSGAICDLYAQRDSRMHIIHKRNGGQGSARNVGIDIATGKYVIFLDSDDYWDLNTIERLCGIAEANELTLLNFSAETFVEDGVIDNGLLQYKHNYLNKDVDNGVESLKKALDLHEYYTSVCLRFYKLQFIKDNKFRFDEGIIHEDESFAFLSYITADRVLCTSETFYKRRYHSNSTMTSKSLLSSAKGYCGALNTLLDWFATHQISETERALFIRRMTDYLEAICWFYSGIMRKSGKKEAKQLLLCCKPVMKKAKIILKYLKWNLKLAVHNLSLWYKLFVIINRLKK